MVKRALIGIVVALVAVWAVFPVYIMVKISLSPPQEVLTQHPSFLLGNPTLVHWKELFAGGSLRQPLAKSLSVATLAALITLAIAIPGSYGISRLPRRWQYASLAAIFLTRAFPEVGIALPIAVRFVKWDLVDTDIGLAMVHVIRVLPIACWILVASFKAVPREIEEQAQVDGCGRLGALRSVVMPLSLGGISVAAIFSWLFSWDEFTYALYLCMAEPTLPLKVYYFINRGSYFSTATYATIITIPVLVVTYALQRFLRAGYAAGALKE